MNKRFLHILLSPVFIAIFITIGIIYFLPDYFSKYKLELLEQRFIGANFKVCFSDLNNNNLSEKIIMRSDPINNASFILYDDENNLEDQWNFSSKMVNSLNPCITMDLDKDGFKEMYFFTQKQDSAFLNIVQPYSKKGIHKIESQAFVDTIRNYKRLSSFGFNGFEPKINSKWNNEFYFTLTTGFNMYPRCAYKYNYKKNKVTKSPYLTNVSFINAVEDIDNDDFEEIFLKNTSNGNELDTTYAKRSDYSLWLNVLDQNLKFLFKPKEFKIPFSEMSSIPFNIENKFNILTLISSKRKIDSESKICIFDINGNLIKEKELPAGAYNLLLDSKKNKILLLNTDTGKLLKLSSDLIEIEGITLDSDSELFELDIDGDGIKEYLNITLSNRKFSIFHENLDDILSFEFPKKNVSKLTYGIRKTKQGNQLYIQNGDTYYIFKYAKNKYYYLEYLIYLSIFMSVFGLVLLILKGQKIKLDKKLAIENEMAELQLKTIKNQIDPHFVFNAMNTISGLVLTNKKLEADAFICNFSDLMRNVLKQSNKITTTLKEELEFIEKYISLQQVRFNNNFKYQINTNDNVDLQQTVPKHVLYSYVENAIKHGLKGKENGILKINIKLENKQLILLIEDNGNGFKDLTDTKSIGTGSGLKIMENIYVLYAKLYKKKISHSIKEFYDANQKIMGVRVKVIISK